MDDSTENHQSNLLDWSKNIEAGDGGEDALDAVVTRGTLDMTDVPLELRYRRPEAHRLHVRLEKSFEIVDLILTDNRRRMLSSKRRKNRLEVRIHHMFMGCDDKTVEAVGDLVGGGRSAAQKAARAHIQKYIRENRDAISFEPTDEELQTRGVHYNLATLLAEVIDGLEAPFQEAVSSLGEIHITWGRRSQGSRSIRFGSYDFDRKLIRIHPALDRDWVPRYFISFIVYHELLHALFPPVVCDEHGSQGAPAARSSGSGKRRSVHTPEFLAMERRFADYDKAMRWEAANLRKILDQK